MVKKSLEKKNEFWCKNKPNQQLNDFKKLKSLFSTNGSSYPVAY